MAITDGTNGNSDDLHPRTDPAIYDEYYKAFRESPLPSGPDAWIQRAAQVSAILAKDAATREKENKSPFAEVALLKPAGLTKVLGPQRYGGGGQGWDVAYKVIREVAKADGSLGQLIGYHLLWSWTSAVVGTDEQNERTQQLIIENNYFVGGAVNPRDNDQRITDDGDHIVFNGFKHFNTGGVVSDLTVLEGVRSSCVQAYIEQTLIGSRFTRIPTSTSLLWHQPSNRRSSSCTSGITSVYVSPSLVVSRLRASRSPGLTPWAGIQERKRRLRAC